MFAYNTSFVTSGETSFFLLYGQDPVLPVDIDMGAATTSSVEVDSFRDLSAYGQQLARRMHSAFDAAWRANIAAQEATRNIHAWRNPGRLASTPPTTGVRPRPVYLFGPRKQQGPSRKLLKQWSGPYRVLAELQPYVNSVVPADGRGGALQVHAERLKPFIQRLAHLVDEPAATTHDLRDGERLHQPGAVVPDITRITQAPTPRLSTATELALVGKVFQSPYDHVFYQVIGVEWHGQHGDVVALTKVVKRLRGAWAIQGKKQLPIPFAISEATRWHQQSETEQGEEKEPDVPVVTAAPRRRGRLQR